MATNSATTSQISAKLTPEQVKNSLAEQMLSPEFSSTCVIDAVKNDYVGDDISFNDIAAVMRDTTKELNKENSTEYVERLLLSQAIALNSLFVSFSRRASDQDNIKHYEVDIRLALKAQSQCRATLETLVNVKNPTIVVAKTANIAQNQQINNGVPLALQTDALNHEQSEQFPTQSANLASMINV